MTGGLATQHIKPAIGSRVLNTKADLLGRALAADLRGLLEIRGVLVLPQVHFSDAELVAFTRTLGTYAPDHPDGRVTEIAIDPARGASSEYTKASFFWHFDGYMNEVPILASLLCARVLSASGGDTEFCNTYAAYEALSRAEQRELEGLHAVHALAAAQLAVEPEPSLDKFREWLGVKSATLPLVWAHRSGRKSLVIGNTAAGVLGMDPLDSAELLIRLRDHATHERFTYRHAWSEGDCVIWDNTGTLHRATPYDPASGRRLVRTKLAGEEPFA